MTEQTQPTDAELMPCPFCGTQPDECDIGQFVVECPSCAIVGPASDNSNAARRAWNTRWGTPAGAGEVVGWMWQHEETGRTGFVDCWQVENGWQENNPRLRLVSKLFTTPQPTQAQAGAVPLTDDQCDAIYEALDAFGREVDHYEYGLPYCTSDGETLAKPEAREVIRQAAHGIKGADHD